MAIGYFTAQTSTISTATGLTSITNYLYRTESAGFGTTLVWQSSPHQIDRGEASYTITDIVVDGARVYFADGDSFYGSDGTAAGTVLLSKQYTGGAAEVAGTVYFGGLGTASGSFGLYKTNGTAAGTSAVNTSIYTNFGEKSLDNFVDTGGKTFFTADYYGINIAGNRNGIYNGQLWVSDGTSAGTVQLASVSASSLYTPDSMAVVGGSVYFGRNGGTLTSDAELWKSDGTKAGTVLVKDLSTSSATDQSPIRLTAVGNTLFFVANDGKSGQELWKSNGTSAGTVMVEDIRPGATNGNVSNLIDVGGTLFFTADDGSHGVELWRSNGTEAGTHIVRDIRLGSTGSSIADLTEVDGLLYFSANDGVSGAQLWRSDGSPEGTFAIVNASPFHLTNVGGVLYFDIATGPQTGLFRTDGTAAGTVQIATGTSIRDIAAEPVPTKPVSPSTSLVPALLMAGLVNDRLPTPEKLDSLASFAQQQFKYYNDVLHSSSAQLGPYEALGRAFASTAPFQTKFAGGTDSAFVTKAYEDVFGRAPTAAQSGALLSQVTYFETLYQRAGLSSAQAVSDARGAVYGQIAGYAALDASQPYKAYADTVLAGFANGETAQYGAVFGL